MDVQTARCAARVHLAIVIGEGARAREELLAVALVRQVRVGLLEDDEVKREGLAQVVHERKLVDDAVVVAVLADNLPVEVGPARRSPHVPQIWARLFPKFGQGCLPDG